MRPVLLRSLFPVSACIAWENEATSAYLWFCKELALPVWLCHTWPCMSPFWKHYRYSAFFVASSRLNWLVFQHRGNNVCWAWTEAVKPIFSLCPVTWSFRQWGHVDCSNHELTQFYSLCFLFIVWLEKHQSCVALNHGRKLEYYLCNYQGSFSL